MAGIMLAVTQPIRVGDWVTFEGNYGVVEDVRLNYTILKTATHQRIVIPNEKLAGGVLKNDTLVVDVVSLDVSVWVPPEADVEAAIGALEDETAAGGHDRRGGPVGDAAERRLGPGRAAGSGPGRGSAAPPMSRAFTKRRSASGRIELDSGIRP